MLIKFNSWLPWGWGEISTDTICWSLWYKYSQNNQFQSSNTTSLNQQGERDEKTGPPRESSSTPRGVKDAKIFSVSEITVYPTSYF